MFENNMHFERRVYPLDDPESRVNDTSFSLDLIEEIALKNNSTLSEIYAQKIFPIGLPFLDLHNEKNKLTTIEHIFKKKDSSLSSKDPKNKVYVIGKLKKIIWQDKKKGTMVVEYHARIQDDDYFI
ncbi:MAG: hypothetical protein GY870_05075 [archaeon]|nr:hypothetical protein [archaeon]